MVVVVVVDHIWRLWARVVMAAVVREVLVLQQEQLARLTPEAVAVAAVTMVQTVRVVLVDRELLFFPYQPTNTLARLRERYRLQRSVQIQL
jgi:hypothetical protein